MSYIYIYTYTHAYYVYTYPGLYIYNNIWVNHTDCLLYIYIYIEYRVEHTRKKNYNMCVWRYILNYSHGDLHTRTHTFSATTGVRWRRDRTSDEWAVIEGSLCGWVTVRTFDVVRPHHKYNIRAWVYHVHADLCRRHKVVIPIRKSY